MGRWSQYDEDDYRLPEGMKRIGYDADTQTYTYRDVNGKIYEGAPGARYGVLQPVNEGPFLCGPRNNPRPDHHRKESRAKRPMLEFPDDICHSDEEDKSNAQICGECLVTPFVYLYQYLTTNLPTLPIPPPSRSQIQLRSKSTSRPRIRSEEQHRLLEKTESRSSISSHRSSSSSYRSQSPRDYLLNGADPKRTLKWVDDRRSPS